MDPKVVIFVLISTFLIVAIYSSSLIVVHAAKDYCTHIVNNQYTCYIQAGGDAIVSVCTIGKDSIKCHDYVAGKIATKLPSGAKEALDAALEQIQNTTKVPNTDILKDNATLQENNDNVKAPKVPKAPEN